MAGMDVLCSDKIVTLTLNNLNLTVDKSLIEVFVLDYNGYWVSHQGTITKRMTTIEYIVGMDVLCVDKTDILTLNKLTVESLIEVFVKDMDKDTLILMGARALRVENQDAIAACIVCELRSSD